MRLIENYIFKSSFTLYASLAFFAVLVYFSCLSYGFSPMDEQWLIVKKTSLLSSNQAFIDCFTKPTLGIYYRPFFLLPFIIDYRIGQLSPFYYHLSNLLFLIVFSILFFRFLSLFQTPKKLAYVLVIFFIIHPVLLHSVAWIPGRNDLILGIFSLSSINCLIVYLQHSKKHFIGWHILFFVCALLTKENAITLPFIYVFLHWMFSSKEKKQFVVLVFLWFTIACSWFILRKNIIDYLPTLGVDFAETMKNFVLANFVFLGKFFIPFNLSVFPTLQNTSSIFGVISLMLLVFLWFYIGVKSKPVALFGLFLYVTLLSIPTWFGSVNSGGEHFEHRMYTSVIGLFLFISQLKINWDNSYIKYFAVLLFVVFVSATKLRMPIYKSEISFTEAGLHDAPDYFLFQVQKGEYEYEQRNFGEAITYFKNALALRKDKAEIYNGLANSYEGIGDHKNAVENFSKAIEIFGYQEVLYINRCTSNFNMNNYDGAMNDLIKLKQQNCKGIPAPLENAVKGKWIEQEFFKLNKLISQNPNVAENYFSRAKRYLNIQNYTNALIDVQKANELEPNNNDYKSLLNQLKENQK